MRVYTEDVLEGELEVDGTVPVRVVEGTLTSAVWVKYVTWSNQHRAFG
jgi:hypothetical protein